ncbi:class I SAM-dependent methyltransferase [Haloarchaeobius amylolyticus]|uniref:Class I SAM-dependent methyltransferase n=1 Tax=Haloarchaeobius amylolyticus TaxID=1198296 RepID=A0ABD6BCQ9_9EURY
MGLKETIQQNISDMQSELGRKYWQTSASSLTLLPAIQTALDQHAEGKLLDAGAGDLLYKPVVEEHCTDYESLDIIDNPDLDYQQDIQDMDLGSGTYDTVFCRNVLEHVPNPDEAMAEIHRVLKSNGTAVVTVPHLAYLHNEPHDYNRYTPHGIRRLAEDVGFEVVRVDPVGGLFSFLGYSLATFLLGATYHLPVASTITLKINNTMQKLLVLIDKFTGNSEYFPLNCLLVAKKKP